MQMIAAVVASALGNWSPGPPHAVGHRDPDVLLKVHHAGAKIVRFARSTEMVAARGSRTFGLSSGRLGSLAYHISRACMGSRDWSELSRS